MNHIEKQILDLIEKRYKKIYIGKLKVTKLTTGYKLYLYLDNIEYAPILISFDCESEEDFLKFIDQELISRQLIKVRFFKIEKDDERRTCLKNGSSNCGTCVR